MALHSSDTTKVWHLRNRFVPESVSIPQIKLPNLKRAAEVFKDIKIQFVLDHYEIDRVLEDWQHHFKMLINGVGTHNLFNIDKLNLLKPHLDLHHNVDDLLDGSVLKDPFRFATTRSEVNKAIVEKNLLQHPELLTLNDFTLYKAKQNGITVGGFYHDPQNAGWLIKEGHSEEPVWVVDEYVAGSLYQFFLGESAPQTELVIDPYGTLLAGSKLLPNFSTLFESFNQFGLEKNYHITFNHKPVFGFFDTFSVITFLADTDPHSGNVGYINHGDHYSFAKIDHGYSFCFSKFHAGGLDDFRFLLNKYSHLYLENLDFQKFYEPISKIAELDFSYIEALVAEKMATVKSALHVLDSIDEGHPFFSYGHMITKFDIPNKGPNHLYSILEKYDIDKNLNQYQDHLLHNLKERHFEYQKIALNMSLEKAIIDHDNEHIIKLLNEGVDLNEPFHPFYNPTYLNEQSIHTKEVTGLSLLKKYWSDVLPPSETDTLSYSDVISDNHAPLFDENEVRFTSSFENEGLFEPSFENGHNTLLINHFPLEIGGAPFF